MVAAVSVRWLRAQDRACGLRTAAMRMKWKRLLQSARQDVAHGGAKRRYKKEDFSSPPQHASPPPVNRTKKRGEGGQKEHLAPRSGGGLKEGDEPLLLAAIQQLQQQRNFALHVGASKLKFIYEEIRDHPCKGNIPRLTRGPAFSMRSLCFELLVVYQLFGLVWVLETRLVKAMPRYSRPATSSISTW